TAVGTVNDRRSVVYETRYWPFELTVRQPVEEMDTGPAHRHPCRSDPFPWSVHESRIVADRWRAEVIKAAGQQGGPPSRFNELMLRVTGRLARWTRQLFPWGPVGGDHR
ncbi:MAG: hypothetical protein IRY98_00820, partial [Alicyclobacillaceae bacterium]|nr:hypothetical protein [Alicyclobacillaceae bacterium]